MKLQTHRFGEYGILFTLCVFAAAWVMQVAGLFSFSDQAFEDLCYRFDDTRDGAQPILLVYVEPDLLDSKSSQLTELLHQIDEAAPKTIGIIAESSLPQLKEIENLPLAKKVVVGRAAKQLRAHNDSPLRQGFIDLDLDGQPIYRKHTTALLVDGQARASFEKTIIDDIAPATKQLPASRFGIKYSGGVDTIPHVNAEDIFAGNIISELIRDRIVLIGPRMNSDYGFATPTATGRQRMSRLELHGHILNSLYQDSFQPQPHSGYLLAILLVFAGLVCQLARQTANRWIPHAIAACLTSIVLSGWLGHSIISFPIPVSAMFFSVASAFSLAALGRFRVLNTAAEYWRLMMDLNRKELETTPEEAWDLLTEAVFQMFYPKRMVLMEMKPNATHLHVVSTINCEPEDIYENRRDAQRSPFRDAIISEHPVNLQHRCFFHKEPLDNEVEYMVPLMFSSQILGFMVISMDKSALEKWKDFENFLEQFGNDMSILIANKQATEERNRTRTIPVDKLKSFPEEETLKRIRSEKLEQQNQIQRLNSAFERSESAMAICDVFGRVLRANSRLIRLLQDVEVVTGETSCVEMISKLTTRPVNDCRRIFHLAIMNNRANQLCIPPTAERPYPSIMFVKPLSYKSSEAAGDINYRRVVIEVIEGRSFEMINNWQKQWTDDICQSANDQMKHLQLQLNSLKDHSQDPANMESLLEKFDHSVSQIRSTFSRCQDIVKSQLTEEPQNCFPLPTLEIYRGTFQQYEQVFESRGIEIVDDVEDEKCIGIANPFLLEKIFQAILDLLSENAFDNSQLFVSAQTIGSEINFQFRNRGGGTPLQGLRKSLVSNEDLENAGTSVSQQPCYLAQNQLDRLAEIREWLEAWDGTLRIANLADYSLNIELTLMNESVEFPGKTVKVQEKSQTPRS